MYELISGSMNKKLKAHTEPITKVIFTEDMKYIIFQHLMIEKKKNIQL